MAQEARGVSGKLAIAAILVVAFTVGTDFTGALLLIPSIENEFAVDITTTQWVLNIYALCFAMFMVAGGKLGDMYGRRHMMCIGLVIFAASSVGCAVSPTIGVLIVARAFQGLGAAMIWPSMLGSGATLVSEERRGVIMGLMLAAVNSGNVAGPLMSGLIVAYADWRYFFAVNVVLACVSLVFCLRFLPKAGPQREVERIDFAGVACLGLAVLALLFALDVGADWGWTSLRLIGLLAVSAALFVAFPFVESKVASPMVPPHWLRHREFRLILSINGLIVPPIFIAFLYFPQYLHKVLGWDVLSVSLGVLPMMAMLGVASVFSGRFYKPLGPKRVLTFGYLLATVGSVLVVWFYSPWGYLALAGTMVLLAVGGGSSTGPAGTATVNAVASKDASLAGGLSFMVHLVVGALGVAGATAIMNATSLGALEAGLALEDIKMPQADVLMLNASEPGGSKSQSVLNSLDTTTIEKVHSLLRDSFTAGMSDAFWLSLASAVLGLIAVFLIREAKLHHALGSDEEEAEAGQDAAGGAV